MIKDKRYIIQTNPIQLSKNFSLRSIGSDFGLTFYKNFELISFSSFLYCVEFVKMLNFKKQLWNSCYIVEQITYDNSNYWITSKYLSIIDAINKKYVTMDG